MPLSDQGSTTAGRSGALGGMVPFLLAVLVTAPATHPLRAHAQEGVRHARPAQEPVLTKPPSVRRFVQAEYPAEALRAGVEADVVLEVEIAEDGRVIEVRVIRGAGRGFDEAAVAAVRAFEFDPAEVDGRPAPVRIEYVYHFRVERVPVAPPVSEEAAPEVVLRGRVRESGTGLPVAGAAVSVEGVEGEVTTDAGGAFEAAGIPPGTHQVHVRAPDYRPLDTEVEVRAGHVTEVEFRLRPLEESPYTTVVRGEREREVVARYTVTQRELTTVPGTFGDPARVVQNLPGVARSPYVLGLLLVRGSYPEDSGVYLDGVQIPILYHFFGGPSVLHPEFLQRIDFYPGNFGVRYGRATGGIVEVETSREVPPVWHGVADLNLFFASGYLEAPVSEDVGLKVGLRRSYYDLIIPLVLRASGKSGTTVVPVYYDYQARLDARLRGDDHLSVFAFGSHDSLDVATSSERDRDRFNLATRTGFHRLTARHEWHAAESVTHTFAPHLGYDLGTFEVEESNLDIATWNAGVRDEVSWRVHPRLELRPGVDFGWVRYRYTAYLPPRRNYLLPGEDVRHPFLGGPSDIETSGRKEAISRTISGYGLGTYLEAVWEPARWLKVIPGVRFDSYFYLGRTRWSLDPRLTVRADVGRGVTLKGGAGIFHQLPADVFLDPDYGNPDLGLEGAEQVSAGVEWRFLPHALLDVQGFYIRRHDQAVPTEGGEVTAEGGFKPFYYANVGWGRSYGMELLLKHDVTERFYGWVAYTLSRTEEVSREGRPLTAGRFDQTHILTAVGSVRPGRGWEVGARFRLVSGNPTTPVRGGSFMADTGEYLPLIGERRSERRPLFHQLDFRVEKTWTFERWMLSLYLDIQNVYNAENVEFTTWDYRYDQSYGVRGLPFLPTLGVKGVF